MNKNQDEEKMNKLCNEAYKLRNLASESINNHKCYLEASKLFGEAIEIMIKFIKTNEAFINSIEVSREVKMNHYAFLAIKEHTEYENDNCLSMYYYIEKDFEKAEEYCSKAKEHIENAILGLAKVKFNEHQYDKNEAVEYDKKNWNYLKKMSDIQYYIFNVSKESKNRNYSKVVDNYRILINKCKELMDITNEYMDVLSSEYIRISKSNYLAMISNNSIEILNLLKDKYSGNNGSISESIFIDILSEAWKALNYSDKAFKINPLWDGYNDVRERQLTLLKDILVSNKKHWKLIYINFEDNKEFLKIMKNIDDKTYKKIRNELSINDNKAFKLWKMGSFWLLFFIIIFGGIATLANAMSFWKLIVVVTSGEVVSLIFGGFALRTTDSLSEEGFLKLISIAFKNQVNFIKLFNKAKKSDESNL